MIKSEVAFISASKYIETDLIQAIEDSMPHYTAGVWRLCCETGVRVSDAVSARVKDFDTDCHFHYIAHKTGKKGTAVVSSDFISRYVGKKTYRNRYVFPSPKKVGCHVTRQTVFNHVKKACRKLGISDEGVSPHSARKHFAVELFHEKGLSATMAALQHKDVGTTMIYALSDDALHKLIVRVRRLERIIDTLFDIEYGDDRYTITDKGKEYLKSHKADSKK